MHNFTHQIIDMLLGPAKAAPLFKVSLQAVCDWRKKDRIPDEHWDRVVELLPDMSIEKCYEKFVREKRKPRKQAKSTPNRKRH